MENVAALANGWDNPNNPIDPEEDGLSSVKGPPYYWTSGGYDNTGCANVNNTACTTSRRKI